MVSSETPRKRENGHELWVRVYDPVNETWVIWEKASSLLLSMPVELLYLSRLKEVSAEPPPPPPPATSVTQETGSTQVCAAWRNPLISACLSGFAAEPPGFTGGHCYAVPLPPPFHQILRVAGFKRQDSTRLTATDLQTGPLQRSHL